jgi:hypothetical protein
MCFYEPYLYYWLIIFKKRGNPNNCLYLRFYTSIRYKTADAEDAERARIKEKTQQKRKIIIGIKHIQNTVIIFRLN